MSWLRTITAALLLSAFAPSVNATHIVGGELYYQYIGNWKYAMSLVVYRDCGDTTNAPFDKFATIYFYDTSNVLQKSLSIEFPGSDTIPLTINNDCATLPDNICYEMTQYEDTITLPPIPGGYLATYQRCCWNLSVTNIYNPIGLGGGSTGLVVTAEIPDSSVEKVNGNPIFQDLTPPYICLGMSFEFNHEAVDHDGDSLSYEIFTPLYAPRTTPVNPPFDPVTYTSGYSLSNVMGGDPLRIKENTGQIFARPDKQGQFVFGVKVKEYRHGKYLGSSSRSYQLNVVNCPDLTFSYFDAPELQCGDSVVKFINSSVGSENFRWHFGDPLYPDSISTAQDPTHHFSDTGKFIITLIANSDIDSICNDTTYKEITILPPFDGDFGHEDDFCTNKVFFKDKTVPPKGKTTSWKWNFGDNNVSYAQDPTHVYANVNTYNVSLIVDGDIGCSDTIVKQYTSSVRLLDIHAGTIKNEIYPREDSTQLTATPFENYDVVWSPSYTLDDSTSPNPVAKPTETTTYIVTATDDRNCQNKDTVTIYVLEYPCGEEIIYVPNAFTPNSDGENDFFRIRGEQLTELSVEVYNRWGQKVYASDDIMMLSDEQRGWDGRFNGELQNSGVYVYVVKARCLGGTEFMKKGNLTLMR